MIEREIKGVTDGEGGFKPANFYRLDDGKLPHSSWPGLYPLYYYAMDDQVTLCAECANLHERGGGRIDMQEVNYEDDELFCDDCSERIPSSNEDD